MAKPALAEVLQIVDPMLSDNFELILSPPPGVAGINAQALRIQCKTATKPGMTIETVQYELFGHTVEFAGKLTYSHTMSVEYVENFQGTITRSFENWIEVARNHRFALGAFKKNYAGTAQMFIYDQTGALSLSYNLFNVFPTEVAELSFDGSAATGLSVSMTLSYDYYEVLSSNVG